MRDSSHRSESTKTKLRTRKLTLPFDISSTPQIYQRTMSAVLKGFDRVICRMDDILIHGRNQMEHDVRVRAVLFRIQKAGLIMNV